MKLYLIAAAATGLFALPFAPTAAFAESASQSQCEAMGGTYIKDGPNSTCQLPPTTSKPGNNPPGTQGSETTTQTTLDGQGNLNNKQTDTTTCTGNTGQCKK